MALPRWIPKVKRPWNPAYAPIWDQMTDTEKRWSWLTDVGMVLAVLAILFSLSGCNSDPETLTPARVPGDAVKVDPDTGCQYIGSRRAGFTPRLDRNGNPMCPGPDADVGGIVPMVNPVTGR
jgi:hypothetical protein